MMTEQEFAALALAAYPRNADDWGSDRQYDAENDFFDAVCRELSNEAIITLEDFSLKAATEERIQKAAELLGFEDRDYSINPHTCRHRSDGRGRCVDCGEFL
jgi:hypothetical protein